MMLRTAVTASSTGQDRMDERAVAALEGLYSGPIKARELVRAREIFAFLRSNGQV